VNATRRRILEHLARATKRVYGLDLINAKVASRYSLYVHMAWLEEAGYIEGVEERVTLRRSYKITDKGRAVLLPVARVR
jgi:DNA-binding PadR family transcriptional regulator